MRTTVLAFATLTLIACEDPFTRGGPAVSPGVVVPGLVQVCPSEGGCSAWSADSRTFYVVAFVGAQGTNALMAVDVATLTFHAVGPLDESTFELKPAPDGNAVFIATQDPQRPEDGLLIKRMSLSDGSTQTVAKTDNPDFVVSSDGTALAYHVYSSSAPDTLVVLDVASGLRRGITVEGFNNLAAFSADGTQLSIIPGSGHTVHLWHIATGVRDTIQTTKPNNALYKVAWSGGAFRLLFIALTGAYTFTDTSLAGGSARIYTVDESPSRILWLPDRSAMWTVATSPICGPADCQSHRYDFAYTTPTQSVVLGAARSAEFLIVSPSPDGHWLAHAEGVDALYLLHQATP